MKKFKTPPEFEKAKIDLEIDFGDFGGLQRFRYAEDIEKWLSEEQEYWAWLRAAPANQWASQFGEIQTAFWGYNQLCLNAINSARQNYTATLQAITNLLKTPEENRPENFEAQLEKQYEQLDTQLTPIKNEISNVLKREIVENRNHLTRFEPESKFITELAEKDEAEAVYALDQFLLMAKDSAERRSNEANGRLMAALFAKNLNRKLRPDNTAFKTATETWGRELKDYKQDYDELQIEFGQTKQSIETTESEWQKRTQEMAKQFTSQLEESQNDLNNLKETYDAHMRLRAPVEYWRGKKEEHTKKVKTLQKWSIGSAVLVFIVLMTSAFILPELALKTEIPWRSIGFFIVISTFALWVVRLFVKLLLSNIHLEADADERVVMASTFMALIRHKEGEEGLAKEDIALVLAPLFRPSTTGVIKDEGGPSALDILTKITGK